VRREREESRRRRKEGLLSPKKQARRLIFGGCGCGVGTGRCPLSTTKNTPKRRVVDVRGKGEGADYEKRAQVGGFLIEKQMYT
jgi:hypothetical protein